MCCMNNQYSYVGSVNTKKASAIVAARVDHNQPLLALYTTDFYEKKT